MSAKCENCRDQYLATAANCSIRQKEKTPAMPTEILRNRDEIVISCTSEMTVMMASRARKESAEKESTAAELIIKKSKSSDKNSIISESSAAVRAELKK